METQNDYIIEGKESCLPFFSIIIPALNAERTIKLCLDAIFSLKYPKDRFEVILVDNGSTDRTVDIAKEYNLKIFHKPRVTIAALRNFGAKMAKGDIYAFLDSDCIVTKDWLIHAKTILSDKRIGITGCEYGIPEDASWIIRTWYLKPNNRFHKVKFIPAGDLLIRKDIFDSVEGFKENLITGEDYDICERVNKAGYLIISDNSLRVTHLDSTNSLKKLLKKEIWYGKGMLPSLKKIFNKTVFLCHVFIVSFIISFISIIFGWKSLWIIASILLITIPIISAFYRNFFKAGRRKIRYFIYLIPIYFTYFLGRSISLLHIYKNYVISKLLIR